MLEKACEYIMSQYPVHYQEWYELAEERVKQFKKSNIVEWYTTAARLHYEAIRKTHKTTICRTMVYYGSEESSIKHGLPGVPEGAAGQEL